VPPTEIKENEVDVQEGEGENEAPSGGSKLVIWLVICGLAVLFLPIYVISTTVKSTNDKLSTELDSIQATLSATPPVDPMQQTLSAQYLDLQRQSKAVGSIRSTLMASHINWPTIMAAIGAYDTDQMAVNTVDQMATGIRISGRAKQEIVAMSYADMLRDTGLFDTVAVESINLQSVMITVTPSSTALPTAVATADPKQKVTATPVPTMEIKVTDFIISVTIKKENATDGRST
jgi:hypothetical protein